MIHKGEKKCKGCDQIIPEAAIFKEEYDGLFNTFWHLRSTCIMRAMRRLENEPKPAA